MAVVGVLVATPLSQRKWLIGASRAIGSWVDDRLSDRARRCGFTRRTFFGTSRRMRRSGLEVDYDGCAN